MRGIRSLLLIAAGAVACGDAPPPAKAPPRVTAPVASASAAPPIDPSEPVLVAPSPVRPAPWLEADAAGGTSDPIGERTVIAEGNRSAIVRTGAGYFAVAIRGGIVGPLAIPERTSWVGLGEEQDAVFAATDRGTLHRAASSEAAARTGGFEERASLPGARSWDAAGATVAAIVGAEVAVSIDGGRTFRRKELAGGVRPRIVLTRHDGAVVASGLPRAVRGIGTSPRTFVSTDGGERWTLASFQPLDLIREGAWIWNNEADCPAVMSADPRRWTAGAGLDARPSRTSWGRALRTGATLVALVPERLPTAADPKAPEPRGALRFGLERPCHPEAAEFGMIGLLSSGDGGAVLGSVAGSGIGAALGSQPAPPPSPPPPPTSAGCSGASCLALASPSQPPASATQLLFFNDGSCAPGDASGSQCKAGAPLTRSPTLALVDRGHNRVLARAAPEGCTPRQAMSLRGLGLLLCAPAGEKTAIHAIDQAGVWAAEGPLAAPLEDARASGASDGTVLLAPAKVDPSRPMRGFVRGPRALGQAGAWREVTAPDAVAYRALDGGGALVIASPAAKEGRKISIWIDREGEAKRELAHDVLVDHDLYDVALHQGQVVFLASDAAGGAAPRRAGTTTVELYLARGGMLMPFMGRRVFP